MYQRVGVIVLSVILTAYNCFCQDVGIRLETAIQTLTNDEQFKHAIISMYVTESNTGKLVYEKNSQFGLAPASCQKVITSVSAFELLGKAFRFRTYIDCSQQVNKGILEGNLYVSGGGDPTFGSDRWNATSEEVVLKKIVNILRSSKIQSVAGDLICADNLFTNDPVPKGWIWEDIGNYYGAGAWGLNWKENQYDITFKTGKTEQDKTEIISTSPGTVLTGHTFVNFVTTGKKGSGDNAFLFSSPFQKIIIARGTVPVSANGFTISGSMPDPPGIFIQRLKQYLAENNIRVSGETWSQSARPANATSALASVRHLDSIVSPSLDSVNYWFLKKSVNLYGEALVKMIAYKKTGVGSTEVGIDAIKEFWSKRDIEKQGLKMIDGSGLSPANRITTRSLVTVMQFAKNRPWYNAFYNALPEMNGIKMKDGYIDGVRSYTGYLKNGKGAEYTFAFIVNNFDGSAGLVREKMWKVLDLLK